MATQQTRLGDRSLVQDITILAGLWLLCAGVDRLWFALDHTVPAWDQSDHLTRALHYWRHWQHPHLLSGAWWQALWQLSPSYRAPWIYLLTVPFLAVFGRGFDQATLVNLGFTGLLLGTVYGLGQHLFTRQIGLWAAGLCLLLPELVRVRTDYLLDYGLVAFLTLAFLCLTLWRDALTRQQSWLYSLSFGVTLGLVLLTKPTGFLFLLVPGLWLLGEAVLQKRWERLAQAAIALVLVWLICGAWYSANWLTIFSSSQQANRTSLLFDRDPPLHTLAAWLYYWRTLPYLVSWPLLLLPLGSLVVSLGWRQQQKILVFVEQGRAWRWLLGFLLGAYLLCSLIVNKDPRHILPYLPGVAIVLAYGLTRSPRRWSYYLRWLTVGTAAGLLLLNLFPLPGSQLLGGQRLPYQGQPWPHTQAMTEIVKTEPYLRSTVGVLLQSPELNAFNIDYYGALANFQVYGRDVGFHQRHVQQDGRSLTWYLKTNQREPDLEFQPGLVNIKTLMAQSPELTLHQSWPLPDGNQLQLYHRRVPPVKVEPLNQPLDKVQLEQVTVPSAVPPGKPVPVTYQLSGPWEQLQQGLLLLTWKSTNGQATWFHDHGIGLGQLYSGQPVQPTAGFRVTEQIAMLPPPTLPPGTYTLEAIYLQRQAGFAYPLATPSVQITVRPQVTTITAPELDLVTQLRELAADFAQGKIDPVFDTIGRINQYDPTQDYVKQAQAAIAYRLNQQPDDIELTYALGLTQVLQRQVQPALQTFNRLTQLDRDNPYAWAYLGFIYLYNWQPRRAEAVLVQAAQLNPAMAEVKTLQAVAAIMQLNVPRAWQLLRLPAVELAPQTPGKSSRE